MRSRYGKDPDGQLNLFGGSRLPAKLRRRKGVRRPPDETALIARLFAFAASRTDRLTMERVNSGVAYTRGGHRIELARAGTADLKGEVVALGRRYVAEVKVDGRPLSRQQREFLRGAIRLGDLAFVVRDSVADFERQLCEAEAGRYIPPKEIFD